LLDKLIRHLPQARFWIVSVLADHPIREEENELIS
jgi:hypothetical protein